MHACFPSKHIQQARRNVLHRVQSGNVHTFHQFLRCHTWSIASSYRWTVKPDSFPVDPCWRMDKGPDGYQPFSKASRPVLPRSSRIEVTLRYVAPHHSRNSSRPRTADESVPACPVRLSHNRYQSRPNIRNHPDHKKTALRQFEIIMRARTACSSAQIRSQPAEKPDFDNPPPDMPYRWY